MLVERRPGVNAGPTPDDTPLSHARAYLAAGLSVIPVRADGSKAPDLPAGSIDQFRTRRPADAEVAAWFSPGRSRGIGIVGGPASGNLVVLDFETNEAFRVWGAGLGDKERLALDGCPVVRTPGGGWHAYVRTTGPVRGCRLARTADGECLVETRGFGQYVLAPGSAPECHPAGRPYRVVRDGWLAGPPRPPIPLEAFNGLAVHAAELNEYRRPAAREVVGDPRAAGDRPGDHFDARVPWGDVLGPHGWRVYRCTPTATYWSRPGKSPPGVSASTGFCRGPSGRDLLWVFSSSAPPFEADTSYSKFGAYCLLNHGGDYAAATRALANAGYGLPRTRVAPGKGVGK